MGHFIAISFNNSVNLKTDGNDFFFIAEHQVKKLLNTKRDSSTNFQADQLGKNGSKLAEEVVKAVGGYRSCITVIPSNRQNFQSFQMLEKAGKSDYEWVRVLLASD